MRNTTDLITAVRTISRNSLNADGTYAISDEEILQYLNDAQSRIQNLIMSTKNIAKIFTTEQIISIVSSQEAYTVPDRVALNKQIHYVEYSATGQVSDYIRLEKVNFFNRDTNGTTYPHAYFKRGNQIMLQPTPSSAQGTIRVMYDRKCDDLAKFHARVNGTPTGAVISLASALYTPMATDEALFTTGSYINLIGIDGTVLLRNGVISSYDAATDALTLAAAVSTYLVGSATLAGLAIAYLVLGAYTTNQSTLPDECENYLIHYSAASLFHRDSSNDYPAEAQVVGDMENTIIKGMQAQTAEIEYVPQINRFEYF